MIASFANWSGESRSDSLQYCHNWHKHSCLAAKAETAVKGVHATQSHWIMALGEALNNRP